MARRGRGLVVLVKGYPRLSETFIAEEIRALEELGFEMRLVSLREPNEPLRHPVHERIESPVSYLPEYLHRAPLRVLGSWRRVRRWPGFRAAARQLRADLRRDPSRGRLRRFGQAMVLAAEWGGQTPHLHAHFLHSPASVARYAALILRGTWSVSAHAKDIWTTPVWDLEEKLASCAWAVTCTADGARRLRALAPRPDAVRLAYHGVDLSTLPLPQVREPDGDRGGARGPATLLSVARAVPKKGLPDLLNALAIVRSPHPWRLVHVGAGAELGRLRRLARRLGIADRIEWRGALTRPAVLDAYRRAELFVLASRIADDGDRDGLPNVLLEACSQELACVTTRVGGIPELIEHRRNGWLVEPGDVEGLARAIELLLADAGLRRRLGRAGRRTVVDAFSPEGGLGVIARDLASSLAPG